jgi:hypothetical protein
MRRRRRLETDAVRVHGGMVLHRVLYGRDGLPVPRRSGLLVVAADAAVDFAKTGANYAGHAVHEKLTKGVLVRAFARACRYPAGWLTQAQTWQVIEYLQAMRHVHMTATFGMLRGSGSGF